MRDAGIDRRKCFITIAVKRRPPEADSRLSEARPLVALEEDGFLGSQGDRRPWRHRRPALTGESLPVTGVRGPHELDGRAGYITVHPSYLLRIPDASAKREAYAEFVRDLKKAQKLASTRSAI